MIKGVPCGFWPTVGKIKGRLLWENNNILLKQHFFWEGFSMKWLGPGDPWGPWGPMGPMGTHGTHGDPWDPWDPWGPMVPVGTHGDP